MNLMKILGLAALAALTAMVLLGTPSAMAEGTALCKVDQSPCKEANAVKHVHEETLAGASAVLLSTAGSVLCNVLFLGDALGLEGKPLVIHGHFTYSGCNKNGSEGCTVSEVSTDSLIEALKEGHETAKVTGSGEFKVHCGSSINCTYDHKELTATATGPLLSISENGETAISAQTLHQVSGELCPKTAKLDITTVPLEGVYVSKGGEEEGGGNTALCKADESPCTAGNVITHVHEETLAGAKATLLTSLSNVECKALFLGSSLGLGTPLVIHGNFTYTECVRLGKSCTVAEVSADSLIEVLKEAHETAKVTGSGEVNVHCGVFINCTYDGENLAATAKGPLLAISENGEVTISEQTTHKVSGICPAEDKLDIAMMPSEAVYIVE
jgi:uncharacterized protein YqgV (UPF0045/DUF77 family)